MESPLLRKTGLCLFACVAVLACWLLRGTPPLIDEGDHLRQINGLIAHHWPTDTPLNTLPGYHIVIAALATLSGWADINGARFFTLLLSLLAVFTFWRNAGRLQPQLSMTRSLQFAFLPILFPFFMLVYVESTSLLMVLASLLAALAGRHVLGGLAGLAACLVDPSNWLWLVFMIVLGHVSSAGYTLDGWQHSLRRYWLYALVSLAFGVWVTINAAVAFINDEEARLPSLHVANIFFLLFVTSILFAPTLIPQLPKLGPLMRRWQTWSRLSVVFVAFCFGFVADHPFNTTGTDFFLRNGLLEFFTSTWYWKLLFFVPVAITLLCLAVLPLRPHWWLIYPACVLFLLPVWLVEQRFYLVPFALFLLAYQAPSRRVELLQLGWFVALAGAIYYMILGGHGFL